MRRYCSQVGEVVQWIVATCHSDLTLTFEEHGMLAKVALFLVAETPFKFSSRRHRSVEAGGPVDLATLPTNAKTIRKRPASAL
eukprot:6122905-Pyramimonas_sp.AAC.1